jgi:hypothetical protein
MFGNRKSSALKANAEHLLDSTTKNVVGITEEAKSSARKLGNKVRIKSKATKEEALTLLKSVKEFLDPEVDGSLANDLTDQIADYIVEWKTSIQDELMTALKAGEAGSRRLLKKRALLALSAAVGAGVLIGYALSSDGSDADAAVE